MRSKRRDRVLAFGCHPDDVEFMCAGTLALLAAAGYEVHVATMTGGEVGSPTLKPQEVRAQRLAEAAAAAAVVGGHYHWAGGADLEVAYTDEYRRRAVRVVREVDPLIVFTHPPTDYLVDHEETSRLVRNAAYIASVPLFDCGAPVPVTKRFPYLYYWDAVGLTDPFGRPLPLSCGVDIGSVMATKRRALAAHRSQRDWLRHLNGWDQYLDVMKRQSADEGRRFGVRYAEGFIQHRGTGHPADNVLKAIFGARCMEPQG